MEYALCSAAPRQTEPRQTRRTSHFRMAPGVHSQKKAPPDDRKSSGDDSFYREKLNLLQPRLELFELLRKFDRQVSGKLLIVLFDHRQLVLPAFDVNLE